MMIENGRISGARWASVEFGEDEMLQLEKLAEDASYDARDKAFAPRMKVAARKLVKAAERLEARET
jgi:hypothetical protein